LYKSLAEAAANCKQNLTAGLGSVLRVSNPVIVTDTVPKMGLESKLESYIQALKDQSCAARVNAACNLAEYGSRAACAVPALIDTIEDRNWVARIAAITALGEIGPAASPAVPTLIEALEQHELCVSAAIALGRIGQAAQSAMPELIQLRDRSSGFERWCAEEALRGIADSCYSLDS